MMVASETRKDCLNKDHICWSPMACATFGYCREINFKKPYSASLDAHWSWADALELIRDRKIREGEIEG